MPFFDYSFLFIFLPATLLIYCVVPRSLRNPWLFLASCLFYAVSSFKYLPLLVGAGIANYFLGYFQSRSQTISRRRFYLTLGIVLNLSLLGFFKYSGMFSETLRLIPALSSFPLIKQALPLGISFYTFKNISYIVDIYRGDIEASHSFWDYLAYLTMFPQLQAGPIMRFKEISGQIRQNSPGVKKFTEGLELFLVGICKKVLLADTAAFFADPLFSLGNPGFYQAWASVFLYSAQIYFDFSGYSDMAIGLAMMFGFESPQNFNSPYKAITFSDFWRRWHMTLSRWLRDYLYIPLGGNRKGNGRTYINLIITMLLGGLWHGASWNFIVWGGYHGALLMAERYLGIALPQTRLGKAVRITFNFIMVSIGWVFFKCSIFSQSLTWLKSMFFVNGAGSLFSLKAGAALVVLLTVIFGFKNSWQLRGYYRLLWIICIISFFLLSLLVAYTKGAEPFLYARF